MSSQDSQGSSQNSGSRRRKQREEAAELDSGASQSTQSQARSNLSKEELERKVFNGFL